jgi:flagellar motor switch protein FliG
MNKIDDLLKKVPQSVKDKFLIKKRERAIEIIKEDLVRKNKTIHDYNDEEMEGMIVDAEKELKNDQLVTILVGIAALEGVSLIIG